MPIIFCYLMILKEGGVARVLLSNTLMTLVPPLYADAFLGRSYNLYKWV